MEERDMTRYVCSKCGSTQIRVRAWIKANENEIVEWCDDSCDGTFECWCEACQETTEVKFIEEELP